jgi:hypothetical protein
VNWFGGFCEWIMDRMTQSDAYCSPVNLSMVDKAVDTMGRLTSGG